MGATLSEPAFAAPAAGTVPTRRLGRTGAIVSVIGMGGFHIGKSDLAAADAIGLIHAGIDRGITFMDNSWDYNSGTSELRMGQALNTGGYREKVFLMTKIDGRTKAAAAAQIDQSLSRLLTDRIDLIQIHEIFAPTTQTASSPRAVRSKLSSRPKRPESSASSALQVTNLRRIIFTCSM